MISFIKKLFRKKPEVVIDIEEIKRFKALETFEATINKVSQRYLEGMTYNIREGNTLLEDAVKEFVKAGMVEMTNSASRVTGRGLVK
jgi:hypothetical protein